MDVAIATCKELPEPDHDEELLLTALTEAEIEVAVLPWDDPGVDWSQARLTILRSTWNYQLERSEFLKWAETAAKVSQLWNPLEIIRWSSHKKYLLYLEAAGIPVVPTELVPMHSERSLASILVDRGWEEVVIKPAVSASSYRTLRIDAGAMTSGETQLRELATDGDVLVQSYLPSVEDYGERALVWIDGELTHAVRKSPRFSGEDESVSTEVAISPPEASMADRAIAAVGELMGEALSQPLLYARIDLAPGIDGAPVVMELELIEPSLFLKQSKVALKRLVSAIQGLLDR